MANNSSASLIYLQGANKRENSLTDDMMRRGSNKINEKVFVLHYLWQAEVKKYIYNSTHGLLKYTKNGQIRNYLRI